MASVLTYRIGMRATNRFAVEVRTELGSWRTIKEFHTLRQAEAERLRLQKIAADRMDQS